MNEKKSYYIDQEKLPDNYPTHLHRPELWEKLGRLVATYGYFEEILMKAIFALTGTRSYGKTEIQKEYEKWIKTLEHTASDTLGALITKYQNAVKKHPDASKDNIDNFIFELRKAAKLRNALCHGSWRTPDKFGASKLLYITRDNEKFETSVDIHFLETVQEETVYLTCIVINSITALGYQFPGSNSPGEVIYKR